MKPKGLTFQESVRESREWTLIQGTHSEWGTELEIPFASIRVFRGFKRRFF